MNKKEKKSIEFVKNKTVTAAMLHHLSFWSPGNLSRGFLLFYPPVIRLRCPPFVNVERKEQLNKLLTFLSC
jgi:hypothetical protein